MPLLRMALLPTAPNGIFACRAYHAAVEFILAHLLCDRYTQYTHPYITPCVVLDLMRTGCELQHSPYPTVHHVLVQALSEVCAVCNDAHIEFKEGRYHAVGAPTEAALVVLVEKLGVADAGLNSRIQQQRAATPEGHADGTCQAYCRRSKSSTTLIAAVIPQPLVPSSFNS